MTALLFYISLIGLVGMFAVKLYEVKRRKRSIVYKVFSQFDEFSHGIVKKVVGTLRHQQERVSVFLRNEAPRAVYEYVVRAIAKTKERVEEMKVKSRGIKKLKENPKVSAFLRDIERAKYEIVRESQEKGDKEEKESAASSQENKDIV